MSSEEKSIRWLQIEAYRAMLAEQINSIDQIAGLKNSEILTL